MLLLLLSLTPLAISAVSIFVLRLCGVTNWGLLLFPFIGGAFAGFAGAVIAYFIPSLTHDTSNLGPPGDAFVFGIIAGVLGALAGAVCAFVLRRRG